LAATVCLISAVGCSSSGPGSGSTGSAGGAGAAAAAGGRGGGSGGISGSGGGNPAGPGSGGSTGPIGAGGASATSSGGLGAEGGQGGAGGIGSGGDERDGGIDAGSDGPAGAGGATALGGGNPNSSGLDRHDALYCGEWQLTTKPGDTIYLVRGGKVVWTHSLSSPGSDEFGDCTMMSNGHILFDLKNTGAQEIVPDLNAGKDGPIVWRYNEDKGGEVHSVQPIGLDKVLVMQNGNNVVHPKLMLIDKTTAAVCTSGDPCVETTWHPDYGTGTHLLARHVRMLANGNLIIPYLGGGNPLQGHVVEYTQDWKIVWDYDTKADPWAAVRLANGDTIISTSTTFREVTHDSPPAVVWEMTRADFPAPGLNIGQGIMHLANGNVLLANWCGNVANQANWQTYAQYWEVNPQQKIVWTVKSWQTPNLGPGSSIQALDQPGVPENPADFQR
jgi:hypothetical protein